MDMTIYEYYLMAYSLIFAANIVLFFANRKLNNKTKALLDEIKALNTAFKEINDPISSNIVKIGDSTFVNCTVDGQPLTQELADSLMSKRTVH